MAVAPSDTLQYLLLLADDNLTLTRDLTVANAYIDLLESRAELTKPPWWERLWNSNITKVVLFCAGVWVGKEMVVVK